MICYRGAPPYADTMFLGITDIKFFLSKKGPRRSKHGGRSKTLRCSNSLFFNRRSTFSADGSFGWGIFSAFFVGKFVPQNNLSCQLRTTDLPPSGSSQTQQFSSEKSQIQIFKRNGTFQARMKIRPLFMGHYQGRD